MKFNPDDFEAFFNELAEDGFHIFSREHAQQPGFYPNAFPSYPEIDMADIKEGDKITIRAFFTMSKTPRPQIDSGSIDLEVESVDLDSKKLFANILTELPATFPLSQGTTIELHVDEVLFIQDR
jgi:hypothetical protein